VDPVTAKVVVGRVPHKFTARLDRNRLNKPRNDTEEVFSFPCRVFRGLITFYHKKQASIDERRRVAQNSSD
jgi:hypothetical protein